MKATENTTAKNTNATVTKTSEAKTPIPIRQMLTPDHPFFDRLVACYLLENYGESHFPGISKAPTRFVKAEATMSEKEYHAMQWLPVGFGEGIFGGSEPVTIRVAEYLGLEKPEVQDLIADTHYCHTNGEVSLTALPSIVKLLNRNPETLPQSVLDWVRKALFFLILQEKGKFLAIPGERSLLNIFDEVVAEVAYPERRAIQHVRSKLQASEQHSDRLLELSWVVKAMVRNGMPVAQINHWVKMVIDHMYAEQLRYLKALDTLEKPNFLKRFIIPIDVVQTDPIEYAIGMVYSDDELMMKAMRDQKRGGDCDVAFVRAGNGQVGIWINKKAPYIPLFLQNLVGLVRASELPKEERKRFTWAQLRAPGTIPGIPQWHFGNGMLLNGGVRFPDVPASQISWGWFQTLFEIAGKPRRIESWLEQQGIEKGEEEPAAPAEAVVEEADEHAA